MNTTAIELLLKQRDILIARRKAVIIEMNEEIRRIESGIETLSGKKVWEVSSETLYDDQNHNYIKSSQEEI